MSSLGNVTVTAPANGATLTVYGSGGSGGSGNWAIYNPFDLNPQYWGEHYERAEDLLFRLTKMANQLEGLPEEDLRLVEEAKQLMADLIVAKKVYEDAKKEYLASMQQANIPAAQPPYATFGTQTTASPFYNALGGVGGTGL